MIINFSIQNFGSIKDKQTLSFEATNSSELEQYYIIEPIKGLKLLKLALIYGANASGKTTILKTLEFLRSIVLMPHEKKTDTFDFEPFLFDKNYLNENSILAVEFVQKKVKYFYQVELNKHAIVREELNFHNPNKANVFKRTTDLKKQFTTIKFGSKIKLDKAFEKTLEANTLWNNTVLGGFLKTNIESIELKEATDWFANCLNSLISTQTQLDEFVTRKLGKSEINKENILEILKKADFKISDILVNKEEKDIPDNILKILENETQQNELVKDLITTRKITTTKIELEHLINNSKYPLPFALESQGTQRYYGFAGILDLLIRESIIFPIDELESSLHPDLYIHFLLTFLVNVKESQILATTHNREILNNRDVFRNDAIWFTDKNETNATELYSLSDFDSKVIRDTSNVYNAYKIGKLGAVPHLGDYYLEINHEKK